MYLGMYKDSSANNNDFILETLSGSVERLIVLIEVGMEKNEDITACIYDLDKPEGERLVVDYYSSSYGDNFTVIEATRNITKGELHEAKVNFVVNDEGFTILRQWEYGA